MKVIICEAPTKISIQEIKIPTIKENEILVRIKYCGICIYDLKRYLGAKNINYPLILGHEPVGIIEGAGKNVKNFNKGERVAVDVKLKCGECENCLSGLESRCIKSEASNGFSQYLAIPEENVYKLSSNLDLIIATLAEPIACLVHGFEKMKNLQKNSFLVIGDGIMGILGGFLAKKIKNGKVTLIGHHDNRLEIARKIGLDNLFNAKRNVPKLEKFNTIIFTVEDKEIFKNLKKLLKPGGNILFIGELIDGIYKFNFNEIYSNEYNLYGSKGYSRKDFKLAVEIIEKFSEFLKNFITKIYSINELEIAFKDLKNRKILKGVLNLTNV